ncbi:MAG: hypothetical protein ACXWNR_03345 [Candidatus Limnocylindrales bacterium]
MVGRAATNPEQRLDSVPSLPVFERLAPPPAAADLVVEIEAWTKPGEVVLDLTGRGGWVARAAISEQRRAADFEPWPLTRLLAEVVLRPPDLRQIDSAAQAIAAAPLGGSLVRRTIDAMYASDCPRCGRPVVLEAMVWEPFARPAAAILGRGSGSRAKSDPDAGGKLPAMKFTPDESLRALSREYRCAPCHEQFGEPELQSAEPTRGDLKLAESVSPSGEIRESMRRRFPAPRPTHPLVDQLIDLHTPRQLAGLHAILTRIDDEERPGSLTATLRLALLHAVILASRLNTSRGKPAPIRISNGSVKVPATREWRERNPWLAFEDGLKLVKTFVQKLEAGTPRAAMARLGPDLASLESGTPNVILVESTPAALRRLGLHGERMAHSGSQSRVRLVLGQAPLRLTPERLATSYHGTGWLFGAGAVSMLPYDSLFRPGPKATAADESQGLARSLGRSLAIASPALASNGRAVILLDDDKPATLVAAALGGAAAGCRLIDARLHRGADSSAGIIVFVPPTGVMSPGARTRANRPLPPLTGGAGDPGTIKGRGLFAPPQRLDDGPFHAGVAAQTVTEAAVEVLKARGEPASFEHILGDLLIGLDRSGQLARLARTLRPPHADDGWSAWIDDSSAGSFVADGQVVGGDMAGVRGGASPRGRAAERAVDRPASGRPATTPPEEGAAVPTGIVDELLELIHAELDRPNNRRIRQIEAGHYWLASNEDRSAAAQPIADRVEWAVFSLLASAPHLTERAAMERTAALFKSPDLPDGALIEACLRSYSSSASTPEAVVGSDQLERRTADHDAVIATLADLGHRLGMRVWIGKRQQARAVAGRLLSDWLDDAERAVHLPLITWAPEGELDRVDCAWYVRRQATFLFEVEWTAMLSEPILVRHARYPVDDKVVRFVVLPSERAELVKFKMARSPLLRQAIEERNWHFLTWNHLAAFAARPDLLLGDLEPYLGLDAVADTVGEQLPLFGA